MRRIGIIRGSRLIHYTTAVLAATAAAAIRVSFMPFFGDRNELVMFYPAVMVSAWLGGVWPGIVATVVSALLVGYLFLEPVHTLRPIHHSDLVALAIFVATGIVISMLNENLRGVAARERSARADADAANRTKDFFMAAVSHDLRAPMNAAFGWADILSKDALDQSQRQHAIEAIRRALNRQMLLVNDLLDSAAILSGTLRVERNPVDVAAVVRAAIEIAEPLMAPKRLQLKVNYESSGIVSGDAGRIQQVIANLLTNAIKFTAQGGDIRIRVGRDEVAAEIEVTDTGKGLGPDALPFVFERFWQGDRGSTRPDKGVGLGLSIAKHLVVLHGGTIAASSCGEGQGATFTVRLPLVKTPANVSVVHHQHSSEV